MTRYDDVLNREPVKVRYVDEKSGFYAGILFFVWPLLAVVSAFRNYNSNWGKNILWAFIAFYGFSFAIGAESQESDIVRYVAEVEYLHGIDMTVTDALRYYMQSGEVDILRTFIAVLLSRITDSQAVLTLVYGIIFGFFFSRNIWYVLDRLEDRIKPITMLLLVCFFLVIPIWNITTFRMWTAAHIFIYGLLPFLFEGKKQGIIIASSAIFVHFALLVPIAIMFSYLLFGNRLGLYFAFFLATFFISEINLSAFNNIIESYAPEIIQDRTSSYRSETKVEEFREGETQESRVWYAIWYGRALKWSIMGFLVVLFLKGRSFFKKNNEWLNLFSFTLLFYGVANLFSSLPSGARFIAIANLLALALIILYIQNRKQEVVMERFVWGATPALLLFIIVAFRIGLYSMSATAIFGNPVIAMFFIGEHISLNDVMKMIL
jgi:hypothetical protein